MPPQSVVAVRLALMWLVVGALLGTLNIFSFAGLLPVRGWSLLSHPDMMVFGWMVQVVFGVGYWFFPKLPTGDPRGRQRSAWACVLLLNLGVALVCAGSYAHIPLLAHLGRGAELSALCCGGFAVAPRVRPFGL